MEHSLPSLELARPWRRATIVASAVAVAELALIVVLTVALVGRPVAERLERDAAAAVPVAPTPAKPAPTKASLLPREETVVLVLNGNGRAGAAGAAGAEVKGRGYLLAGVGNAPRSDYNRTFAMYRAGKRGEAERLARDLGGGVVVAPLDGIEPGELMGAHVALVLGP